MLKGDEEKTEFHTYVKKEEIFRVITGIIKHAYQNNKLQGKNIIYKVKFYKYFHKLFCIMKIKRN